MKIRKERYIVISKEGKFVYSTKSLLEARLRQQKRGDTIYKKLDIPYQKGVIGDENIW